MRNQRLWHEVETLKAELASGRERVRQMTAEEAEEALSKPGRPVTAFSDALISQLRGERPIGEGRHGSAALMTDPVRRAADDSRFEDLDNWARETI